MAELSACLAHVGDRPSVGISAHDKPFSADAKQDQEQVIGIKIAGRRA